MRIYYKILAWLISQAIVGRIKPMAFMDLNKDGSVDILDLIRAQNLSMK